MTLPSSGDITSADIRNELRLGSTTQFVIAASATNAVNWLADRNGASVTLPTHLYGKAAVKLTDFASTASNQTGGVTFNNVSFGPNFSGRHVFIATYVWSTADVALDLDFGNVSIDGIVAGGGADSGEFFGGGPTAAAGIFIFPQSAITGTSGDVTLNWTGSNVASGCAIGAFVTAGLTATEDTYARVGTGSGGTSNSTSLTTVSNGVIMQAVCRASTTSLNFNSGATTTLLDNLVDTSFRCGLAFTNRWTAGAKTVSWTAGGAAAPYGHVARSYG